MSEPEPGDSEAIGDQFSEEDYAKYQHSMGSIIKKIWICIQALMMTWYMVHGLVYYTRILKAWTKVQWLLLFQGVQVIFLVVNEFVFHNMTGVYILLALGAYGHFLTFCLVMDSCLSRADNERRNMANVLNRVGRILFHLFFVGLFVGAYFTRDCNNRLYPKSFLFVGCYILALQLFDLIFYWRDYLIDWERQPPTHVNRLYYNKELFKKQTKILFITNLAFGTVSLIVIVVGSTIMNRPETAVDDLTCYSNNMWIETGIWGNCFIMCHQILILMKINMSQMVLIKVPNSLGLFEPPNALQRIGASIRSSLLGGVIDRELDEIEKSDSKTN